MKKWNYKCVAIKRMTDINEFNKEGEDGWELVTIVPSYNNCGIKGVFKKEITDDKPQQILHD